MGSVQSTSIRGSTGWDSLDENWIQLYGIQWMEFIGRGSVTGFSGWDLLHDWDSRWNLVDGIQWIRFSEWDSVNWIKWMGFSA